MRAILLRASGGRSAQIDCWRPAHCVQRDSDAGTARLRVSDQASATTDKALTCQHSDEFVLAQRLFEHRVESGGARRFGQRR